MGQSQRSGQRKNRKLAEKRASQPCLWRCIYRFLADLRECVETKVNCTVTVQLGVCLAPASAAHFFLHILPCVHSGTKQPWQRQQLQ
jgi:hypothetical protein